VTADVEIAVTEFGADAPDSAAGIMTADVEIAVTKFGPEFAAGIVTTDVLIAVTESRGQSPERCAALASGDWSPVTAH